MENITDKMIDPLGLGIIVPKDWTPTSSMIKVVGVGGGGCDVRSD